MSNKSLAEKLAAAKANSPINDLTLHQQTLKITHELMRGEKRELSEEHKKNLRKRNKEQAKDPVWKKNQKEGARRKRKDPEYLEKIRKVNQDPERRAKISAKAKRSVESPFGTFASQKDFDEEGLIGARWIDRRQMMPHLYYYSDEGPGEPTYENVVNTPLGKWRQKGNSTSAGGTSLAFKAHVENNDEHAVGKKDIGNWWKKMKRDNPQDFYISSEVKKEWLDQNNGRRV